MTIEDDFVIGSDRVIQLRADASEGQYSALELHRWLQSLADDPVNDNTINITSPIPSARITDNHIRLLNGFTITPDAAQALHDGVIEVVEPPEEIHGNIAEETLPSRKVDRPTTRLIRGNDG